MTFKQFCLQNDNTSAKPQAPRRRKPNASAVKRNALALLTLRKAVRRAKSKQAC